jgi:hypothetical protein
VGQEKEAVKHKHRTERKNQSLKAAKVRHKLGRNNQKKELEALQVWHEFKRY